MKKRYSSKKRDTLPDRIIDVLRNYVKGQLILMILVSIIFWAILSLLKVKYALLLGIVSGAASAVPVLGVPVAAILAAFVAAFDGNVFISDSGIIEAVTIFLIYIVVNQVIDWIISPLILSKPLNVHPIILLLAVMISTLFFGIIGTIFAIPVFLVLKVTYEYYYEKKI